MEFTHTHTHTHTRKQEAPSQYGNRSLHMHKLNRTAYLYLCGNSIVAICIEWVISHHAYNLLIPKLPHS